jgi:two-component system sensor histidine kinase FlrB
MSTSFPITREPVRDLQHPLTRAFASFTEAAASLERVYGQLQGQVSQLRQELEVTNRDLTASLEENRRIRERLRRILEGLPCGVLVVEAEAIAGRTAATGISEDQTRISTTNPEAQRLLGGSFGSIDALPSAVREALDRAKRSGQESELALGEDRQWVAIGHAWLEESEACPISIFILRDISDAKRLEHDREQLRRQQALVEVSALLAHEIRNPLGSLELFAGLLAEANLEGESRRWIEHVQAGLRTLSATVNNVLHLHTATEPELALIDAGELLKWAYDFLLPLARQARVDMQLINDLDGVVIQADRHRLEQVLLNLALNAFRFMPAGGWLALSGSDDLSAESIAIEVRDTGPGIASADLPRIFEAGFSTRPGSSGLGLAVCHRIVEQHGGSIDAESNPGYGAIFRLRLPRAQKPAITILPQYSERAAAADGRFGSGLVVES